MLQRAANVLRGAQRVVVFTGAGISAESGVATFRDAQTGLWARYDPEALATPQAFRSDPDLVWGWYEWRRAQVMAVRPNAGHSAVAAIESRVPNTVVVTQNVDDLHERAGSQALIHLHGSLFTPRCSSCGDPSSLSDPAEQPVDGQRISPPRCAGCGAAVRPGVVWFGEPLPEEALAAAVEAASACDVLLSVGTSAVVYPAAEIPLVAARGGATVVQINPQSTPLDRTATLNLRGTATTVLPGLVAAAWPS